MFSSPPGHQMLKGGFFSLTTFPPAVLERPMHLLLDLEHSATLKVSRLKESRKSPKNPQREKNSHDIGRPRRIR
ncbi:hypothetical protein E2C01_091145 [Portunus trituberculatus]|uniref:Uncharacterized protein n=1 Tax=Portunus trituberculatus TaxID=210409 RepID=A0A5B7JNL7_PORTR|nr:hypothetical protein [Portunus trituberculatus]